MSNTPALVLDRVAKLYGSTAALRATSLVVPAGTTMALLGPNGSGKTTLLKIVAGVTTPTLGQVTFFGNDLASRRRGLRTEIGLLAAETYLYDDLTATENLHFILTMAGRRPSTGEITEVLERVRLDDHAGERVRSFSSGMKRRLALARVLALAPRLLLLDEPYNSLDAAGADLVDAIVSAVTARNGAVLLATHDADRALSIADSVAALDAGALNYLGTVGGYSVRHSQARGAALHIPDLVPLTVSPKGRGERPAPPRGSIDASAGYGTPPRQAWVAGDGGMRAPSTWAAQAWAVFRKDVLLEARTRVNINAMIFFAGMVLLVFSFALGPNRAHLQMAAGGILWLAFIFAGLLAFGRVYQLETENNAFEGLLLVALNRSAIYLGKLLGAMVVMLLIEIIVLPIMAILYDIQLLNAVPGLFLVGVLGTLGFASIGALYGALTMSLRAREVLLPLLMLPVTVPVILAAVKGTTGLISGHSADLGTWLELLAAFDIIFVTAGLLTFDAAFGD